MPVGLVSPRVRSASATETHEESALGRSPASGANPASSRADLPLVPWRSLRLQPGIRPGRHGRIFGRWPFRTGAFRTWPPWASLCPIRWRFDPVNGWCCVPCLVELGAVWGLGSWMLAGGAICRVPRSGCVLVRRSPSTAGASGSGISLRPGSAVAVPLDSAAPRAWPGCSRLGSGSGLVAVVARHRPVVRQRLVQPVACDRIPQAGHDHREPACLS